MTFLLSYSRTLAGVRKTIRETVGLTYPKYSSPVFTRSWMFRYTVPPRERWRRLFEPAPLG